MRYATLALVLLAGCGGAPPPPPDGAEIAAEFLAQVRAGRFEVAHAGTSKEFKSFMGRDELRKFVKENPALGKPVTPLESGAPLQFAFAPVGVKGVIRVGLGFENDEWKVESLSVGE